MSKKKDKGKYRLYFPHKAGARNDPKLIKLLRLHGHEAKSVYWDILEILRESEIDGYKWPISDISELPFLLHIDPDKLTKFYETFLSLGLFFCDDSHFWSVALLQHMEYMNNKSLKASESASKRWEQNTNAMRTHTERNASAMQLNESKGNKPLGLFSGTFQSQEDSKGAGFTPQALLGGLVACCPEMKKKEAESLVQEIKLENAELIEKDLSEGLEKSVQNGEIDIIDYLKSYTQ
jgi:hypothetical protein